MSVNIQNLTKVYGEQKAIDNLSFEVKPGEILGFLGPNGAGKTTTMKIMTCFLQPTEGTVTLGEYNIFDHPLEIRRRVGYLPEHNPLYLDMYVHEFLRFVAGIYQLDKKQVKQRIEKVIEMTGLGREQHKKIGMLSKGYRQRVGLSQALIHDPEVLILDEPTTGLDPNQIIDIRNLIKNIGQDKTVIFSSHILSEVESVADRVVIINRGKIVADQATDNIRNIVEDENQVIVEFEKPGFQFAGLEKIEGVKTIEQISETEFRIHTELEVEIRPQLFQECARQENIIMTLNKQVFTLEEAFRKLTQ
ncbi:MAG: gliding motility-associated ABC transporter ATP-binding subunit GldA [Bacteroidetes bacterium]|nr:gliding motility-associated ABC transporter ATP-binding subunit GldA [Bacteroidota bacterium]